MRASRVLLAAGVLAGGIVLLTGRADAAACTRTWDGGAGTISWHTAANWAPDGVPTSTDHVCIPDMTPDVTVTYTTGTTNVLSLQAVEALSLNGGTLNLTDSANASSVTQLTLAGATLGGLSPLTVTGTMSWSSGTQSSAGGSTTIAAGAQLSMSGSADKAVLGGRALSMQGSATRTGGRIALGQGSVFTNAGSFDDQVDQPIFISCCGANPRFDNTGTYRKTAGTGLSDISVPLQITGTLEVNSGAVRLGAGGAAADNGNFTIATGTALELNGNRTMSGPGAISGGTLRIIGGTVTMNRTVDVGDLTLSGGTLTGTVPLTIPTMNWLGGTLAGSGNASVTGPLTMSGSADKLLSARPLISQGTALLSGGRFVAQAGGVFTNAGTLVVGGDFAFAIACCGANPLINNTGTFRKAGGAGTSDMQIPFDNDGTVEVLSGTLRLAAGGATEDTGAYTLAAATQLELNGNRTMGGTQSLTGTSAVVRSIAGTTIINRPYDVRTTVSVGGTVNFNGTVNAPTVSVSGGALAFNTTVTLPFVALTGGTLGGTGAVTIPDLLWTGGVSAASATVPPTGRIRMFGPDDKTVRGGRNLVNQGSAVWNLGRLAVGDNAKFVNAGTLDMQGDFPIVFSCCLGTEFVNTGTFRKSAGTGLADVQIALDNDGVIDVRTGSMRLVAGGGTPDTGSYTFAAGTALDLNGNRTSSGPVTVPTLRLLGGTTTLSGPVTATSVAGTGGTHTFTGAATVNTLTVTAAVLNLNSAASITAVSVSGGTLQGTAALTMGTLAWSGGAISGPGSATVSGNATISGGGDKLLGGARTLRLAGNTTWTAGRIGPSGGATLHITGTFDAQGDMSIFLACCGATPQVTNDGTFRKSAGTGTTQLTLPYGGTGTLRVDTGTVQLTSTFLNYTTANRELVRGTYLLKGTFKFQGADIVRNAATVVLDGAGAAIVNESNVNGLRNFGINTGSLTVDDRTLGVPAFTNSGTVTVDGTGALNSTAAYTQLAGTTSLPAATSVLGGTSVNVGGGVLDGAGTVNSSLNLTGGEIRPSGALAVTGTYAQSGLGGLVTDVGPAGADRLAVTGDATVGGILFIVTEPGFLPSVGDVFQILSAANRAGTFDTVQGSAVEDRFYEVRYDPDGVSLLGDRDSDGDGLSDVDEIARGTDPNDADSDDDGLSDGDEVARGTNPADADSDDDGLSDGDEVARGTNPADADSDDDGLSDGDEVARGTDPLDSDSDDDGVGDNADNCGTTPNSSQADADGDGAGDACDPDDDNDGATDADEVARGTNPFDADTDDDGLSDSDEAARGTNPFARDTDHDGLSDGDEVNTHHTDPRNPNSDGDILFDDGDEVAGGSDPNDPCSIPTPAGPVTLPCP